MPKIIHSLPLSYGHLVLSLWCPYFRFDLTVIARLNSFPWTTTEPWENITSGQITPGGYSTKTGKLRPEVQPLTLFQERNPLFLLGFLYIIGCPVQLISEVFWVATHICLVLRRLLTFCLTLTCWLIWWFVCPPHSVCWIFVKRTYFKSLPKVYYRSVFADSSKAFIFEKFAEVKHPE